MGEILGKRAGAGAGKTFNLALRYLQILFESPPNPTHLKSIIAITFTNKAAAEMRERILCFLKELALETEFAQNTLLPLLKKNSLSPTSQKAEKWLDLIISHYSDLQIKTIDSFLLSLLKGLAFDLNINPDQEITFNEKEVFEKIFLKLFIKIAEDNSSKPHLFPKVNYKKIWEEALSTFLKTDQRGGFYPENNLKKRLTKEVFPIIKKDFPDPPLLDQEKLFNTYIALIKKIDELYQQLKPSLSSSLKNPPEKIDLTVFEKIFLSKKDFPFSIPQNSPKISLFSQFKNLVSQARNFYFQKYFFLYLSGYYPLLQEFKKELNLLVCREGILPGSEEWTALIKETLKKESLPLIYALFSTTFKHILFDEFQDTSRDQWDSIRPLIEDILSQDGTLFIVGDPKQAIFGWRGGEWEIYKELFSKKCPFPFLEENQIKEEILPYNYRSHPFLILFFNLLFSLFSEENCAKDTPLPQPQINPPTREAFLREISEVYMGQKNLTEQRKFRENLKSVFTPCLQKSKKNFDPLFKLHFFEVSPSIEKDFSNIKESLIELVQKEWESIKFNEELAILVRKNEEANLIASFLLENNFPVITENSLKLNISKEVKGLISLLYHFLYPEKPFYLLGILKSGIVTTDQGDSFKTSPELLWKDSAFMESFIQKLNHLKNEAFKEIPDKNPYELLWFLVEHLNLPKENPFINKLLETTYFFVKDKGGNLPEFLEFWEREGQECKIGLPEKIKAVKILTVHKAKGLEFDSVIVIFNNWATRSEATIKVVEVKNNELEGKFFVYLKEPIPEGEIKEIKIRDKIKKAQEEIHLLYVALTRAKRRLYLFFPEKWTQKRISPFKKLFWETFKILKKNVNSELSSNLKYFKLKEQKMEEVQG